MRYGERKAGEREEEYGADKALGLDLGSIKRKGSPVVNAEAKPEGGRQADSHAEQACGDWGRVQHT
jgi:hypothetical protein